MLLQCTPMLPCLSSQPNCIVSIDEQSPSMMSLSTSSIKERGSRGVALIGSARERSASSSCTSSTAPSQQRDMLTAPSQQRDMLRASSSNCCVDDGSAASADCQTVESA